MDFAALFPGQGSQAVGMGTELFAEYPPAKDLAEQVDRTLGYSLSSLILEGPAEKLTLTENAQPALLLVSSLAARASGLKPKAAAGHSLGEYSALVSAEALDILDAIQLVHKRGCYMQEAVKAGEGKMLAVLGLEDEDVSQRVAAVEQGIVEVANYNAPGQVVVAGDAEGVDAFAASLSGEKVKLVELQVSAPFHTSLMAPAAERLKKDLDAVNFSELSFPVYSNVSAEAIQSAGEARELLKQQVCSPVRWTDSMKRLFSEQELSVSLEFGPGKVLSNLLKRIDKSITRHNVDSPKSAASVCEKLST